MVAEERFNLVRVRSHTVANHDTSMVDQNRAFLTYSGHKTEIMHLNIGATLVLAISIPRWALSLSHDEVSEHDVRQLSNLPRINIVGDNGGKKFPLGLCEGDCDRDADCKGNLVCYQRGANESVPGCSGGKADSSRGDYCVAPRGGGNFFGSDIDFHHHEPVHPLAPTPRPPRPAVAPTGPFYLQLFWRQGFKWNRSNWCMKCDGGRCSENKEMYLEACDRRSSLFSRAPTLFQFQHYHAHDDSVQIQIVNKGHFPIQKDLCLQRRGRNVRVEKCNASDDLQRWVSPVGRTSGSRFELAPLSDPTLCITTQRNYPKHDGKLELDSCRIARGRDQTSLWTRYYYR